VNWGYFLAGVGAWFLIQNLVLPDAWAIWLSRRRNFPALGLVCGVVFVVVSMVVLASGLGEAIVQVVRSAHVELWVWLLLGGGSALIAICVLVCLVRWLLRPARVSGHP
jgi:hypothetical protein